MAIDLMKIQPHKVSRDLSGYITYLYGPGKIGKTTFGVQMPGALLLAFEKGYNQLYIYFPKNQRLLFAHPELTQRLH